MPILIAISEKKSIYNQYFGKTVDLSKMGLPAFFTYCTALTAKHVIIVGKVEFPSCSVHTDSKGYNNFLSM